MDSFITVVTKAKPEQGEVVVLDPVTKGVMKVGKKGKPKKFDKMEKKVSDSKFPAKKKGK